MEITGTDSKINKLTNDKEVKFSPVSDFANSENTVANKSANATLKDGTSLNTSKGKIPASGFLLGGSDTPSFVKNAEQAIQEYAGDKRKLQIINAALEKLNLNEGIDNLTDEDMMAFMMLGFDLQSDLHGQVIITEISSGDAINLADFVKLQGNLKNTVTRTIANAVNNPTVQAPNIIGEVTISPAAQDALIDTVKGYHENVKYNKEVVEPLNKELDENIKKYEAIMADLAKQTTKIDNSISQLLSLKTQAVTLMDKAKVGTITDIEKRQLLNLASTLEIKQKELLNNQKDSELLMNQAEQTFAQFAPNLPESERSSKELIQGTLKAKLSGQALTIEQTGVDNIVKEIYKRTAGMDDNELAELMQDKDARLKLMAPMNKFLDRISQATKLSELSSDDISTLWKDFRFKAVEENGKLEYYYYATDKSEPVKVTKEDIRNFKTQLNNMVNSPELFQMARAAGQISLAYDKDGIDKQTVETILAENKPNEKVSQKVTDSPVSQKEKSYTPNFGIADNEIEQKRSKWSEQAELDKSIQRKRDEEKYHEKQIEHIHENRREINKYLDKKRVEKELEK